MKAIVTVTNEPSLVSFKKAKSREGLYERVQRPSPDFYRYLLVNDFYEAFIIYDDGKFLHLSGTDNSGMCEEMFLPVKGKVTLDFTGA